MFGHRYADEFEHFYALFFCGLLVRTVNVKKGDFVKLVSYRENGVERRHRLLENHCDFSTPDFRHFGDRRFCNVVDDFAFLKNLSVAHFAVLVRWKSRFGTDLLRIPSVRRFRRASDCRFRRTPVR